MKKSALFLWAITAIIFGWAATWFLANGARMALSSLRGNVASVSAITAGSTPTDASSSRATSSPLAIVPTATTTPDQEIKIIIGGDIMLDRTIRAQAQTIGYDSLFAGIAPLFHSADITVANLEGPITTFPSKTLLVSGKTSKDLIFTFATTTAHSLKNAGISLVSLANNHTYNFGAAGLAQTKSFLTDANVEFFGDPLNASSTEIVKCLQACFAFVGYHEFNPGLDRILADITRLSNKGYTVIVMPHWGDEYAATAPKRIREKARQLVAAGANLIIGSHPHVIENRERINNVPVIYSLGNLVFDQYFSEEVKNGHIAELTFKIHEGRASLEKFELQNVHNEKGAVPTLVGKPVEFKL